MISFILTGIALVLLTILLLILSTGMITDEHPQLDIFQMHHGYLILLAIIPNLWIQIPAIIIGLDDIYQHARHLGGDVLYISPLKRLFYSTKFGKSKIVQRITNWFDKLLGSQ